MRRESHVRFWESGGVRFPSATRLPPRLRRGQRSPDIDRSLSELLQRKEAAFEPWRPDPGPGIF